MPLILRLILLCTFPFLTSCETHQPDNSDLTKKLDELVLNKNTALTEIPGIEMIIIKNGKVIFNHAAGMARIEKQTPLTTDHKVRVASISKFVLTLAFMNLVENGQVNLDNDISDYLDFKLRNPNFPNTAITSRQLLTHTSSIRDGSYYFLGPNENFKDFFFKNPDNEHFENGAHFASKSNEKPGEYFTYSNLNFGIIAGIIENVTNKRMDIFVQETLMRPLDLNATFNVCDLSHNNYANLATLYRRGEGGITWAPEEPWKEQVDGTKIRCHYESNEFDRNQNPDLSHLELYNAGNNPTLFSPQGGLRASANDLTVIMQMMLNEGIHNGIKIIDQTSLDMMFETIWKYDKNRQNGNTGGEAPIEDQAKFGLMTEYGLSTHIVDFKDWNLTKNSQKFYGHLGTAYGLEGQFWFNPETKDGIIILITGMGDDPTIPPKTSPMSAIEETALKFALQELKLN